MDGIIGFFDIEVQLKVISHKISEEEVFELIYQEFPAECKEILCEHITTFSTDYVIDQLIKRPNYEFLESEYGKRYLDQSELLQLSSGLLTTLDFHKVLSELAVNNGVLCYESTPLSYKSLSIMVDGFEIAEYAEFIKIAALMLESDELFYSLYNFAMHSIKKQTIEQQITSLLVVFYPILMKDHPNVHISYITENISSNCEALAYDAILQYYSLLFGHLPMKYIEIVTKALTTFDETGILQQYFRAYENRDEIIKMLEAEVDNIQEVEELIEKPKRFKENYNGNVTEFIVENKFIPEEGKFEILSRNLDDLEEFFKLKIETVTVRETVSFVKIIRQCLADFLLSGEGQAVEKVINVVAKICAEELNVDKKSCLFVVCGCTMINTQFDFEIEGKQLQRYIQVQDFVKMMQNSPGIDCGYFSDELLRQIYFSLKETPLGINHDIFQAIQCQFMTCDARIAQAVGSMYKLLALPQQQKPNYSIMQYFDRTLDCLCDVKEYDNEYAVIPILLEHALHIIETSQNIEQIKYYCQCLDEYCVSFGQTADSGYLIAIALTLMTSTGLLNHPIMVENELQLIKQMIQSTQFALKTALVSNIALKMAARIHKYLDSNQLRMTAIFQLNLHILGFSSIQEYSAIDYPSLLSDSGKMECVRAAMQYLELFRFCAYQMFTRSLASLQQLVDSQMYELDIELYDNLHYLVLTQLSEKSQQIPATKSVSTLQLSQKYKYVAEQAVISLCVEFLENAPQDVVGATIIELFQASSQNAVQLSAQLSKIERQLVPKFTLLQALNKLKISMLSASIGALATRDVQQLFKETSCQMKLNDYLALQAKLLTQRRYRAAVQINLPQMFSFQSCDSTQLASAVIASIVADDVLGLKTSIIEIQNLSTLYYINGILGLKDINLALLKHDKAEFFKQLQTVKFQSVQQDFIADCLSDRISAELLQQIEQSIKNQSETTINLLLIAYFLQIPNQTEQIKLRLNDQEIGLVELIIGILCKECQNEFTDPRLGWIDEE